MAFKTWREARDYAQTKANETGADYGLWKPSYDGMWPVRRLPGERFRFGHELRCEVVRAENLYTKKETTDE